LWKSHQHAPKAADALRFTSRHLLEMRVVDDVIEEPLGGAHRDHHKMAARMKSYLVRNLAALAGQSTDELIEQRYAKFRRMGVFLDSSAADPLESTTA
jgi:acetyl-CoA carboxylase carboxyl transferase subunit alpha